MDTWMGTHPEINLYHCQITIRIGQKISLKDGEIGWSNSAERILLN